MTPLVQLSLGRIWTVQFHMPQQFMVAMHPCIAVGASWCQPYSSMKDLIENLMHNPQTVQADLLRSQYLLRHLICHTISAADILKLAVPPTKGPTRPR